MIDRDVIIDVWGEDPVPQGSKSISRTGRMYEANKKLDPWRKRVAQHGREEMERTARPVLEGPVFLDIVFVFTRPKYHYRANGALKPSAPKWHTKKPDTDKLVRAIGDALTGIVWKDDSQIARIMVSKVYTSDIRSPGVSIRAAEMYMGTPRGGAV